MASLTQTHSRPYQPLDGTSRNIRLVRLRPGPRGRPQCDMSVFDLADAPPFFALSYTWGPTSPTFAIPVNDGIATVRKGLYRFLQAYEGDEYLWIDQLCIDQLNVMERNHQVSLMSGIYSQSQCIIVWLGRLHMRPRAPIIFNDTHNVEALAILLQHDYFRRIWIVQEVLLAQRVEVLCMHKENKVWISWRDMCKVVEHSHAALQLLNVPFRALGLLTFYDNKSKWSLADAIRFFSGGYCQDTRDKVYGLMGIIKQQETILVDYRKSAQEVLLDVAISLSNAYEQALYNAHPYIYAENVLARYRLTMRALSELMGINGEETEGLDQLLGSAWSIGGPSITGFSTLPMGFSPAVTVPGSPSSTQDVDVDQSFLDEKRAYWWYKFVNWERKFYCPPVTKHPEHWNSYPQGWD